MKKDGINVYTVRTDVRCVKCGNIGAYQHYGKHYPHGLGDKATGTLADLKNKPTLSPAVGFGGTIPYKCLCCGEIGLIDMSGLEGYDKIFETIKD